MNHNTAAVAVGGVRNSAGGNYSAVFGGADNGANNAGAVADWRCQCTASACVLIRGRRLAMKPTILPQWLLAVSATLASGELLCCFRRRSGRGHRLPQLLLAVS
jgi:hypothetical protein